MQQQLELSQAQQRQEANHQLMALVSQQPASASSIQDTIQQQLDRRLMAVVLQQPSFQAKRPGSAGAGTGGDSKRRKT